ncbi:putative protein kinase RLK-Pelle-SD-2b family [Helianthus annuus]|nr:putative protein kinase RLK-Pelle-SD-2b family [Helianthus annuus]KAJ0670207.1 putative protein kinase RLK-Pelle-SD-2b family [Helianthus annuus]
MKICSFLFAFFLMLMLSCYSPIAQINTTAYISTTWTTPNSYGPVPILLTETKVAKFACGFISRGRYIAYQFAIFISPTSEFPSNYEVVWSANRDHPVTTYITQNVTAAGELVVRDVILNFTAAGDLVLKDGDGSIVWTTNTAGKSVAGMNLTHTGNLVLFDHQNSVVWQSFDHPTDSLLLGQMLYQDQKLKSSVSDTNSSEGMYFVQVTDKGLSAFVESNPPQPYYISSGHLNGNYTNKGKRYARFLPGNLSLFIHSSEPNKPDDVISIRYTESSAQYMKLMPNGRMQVFERQPIFVKWEVAVDYYYNGSAFIKVQNVRSHHLATILGSTIGSFVLLLVVARGFVMYKVHKRKRDAEMEEEYLIQVPGMPTRFYYEDLKTATENFSKKLGEGGFGSVFEGSLEDGSKIAVKCLEGLSHVKKSFLAEVESIGSIHHVNLVRLRGFCTWKSQRFLVYDFMSNGSLDKWIYHGVQEQILEWECIKKTILDIARGLAYLHEECRQKIVHLDIKPQNILLDNDFNAKVSDFGLSKLIDKSQTEVMTTIKGTRGYMAPEWQTTNIITEKLDVYSLGSSLPEESWYLLSVFEECWEHGTLLDMVDKHNEDILEHNTEVVEMMKVAAWCLQTNFKRRPSMSVVVKVLEGVMHIESNLDYNFTDPRIEETEVGEETELTLLSSSLLSGPR